MSTRSVVAIPNENGDGWRGRYIHSDGYPEWVGACLWHIVKRYGLEQATRTLVHDNYGWSCLTTDTTRDPEQAEWRGEQRFVEGYGYPYDDEDETAWILSEGDKWGTEWAYLLTLDGLIVMEVDGDTTLARGLFAWNGEEPYFVRKARERFGLTASGQVKVTV